MKTQDFYENKAIESGYDDFLHWLDCYDLEKQQQKIVEWTDELIESLTKKEYCNHNFQRIERDGEFDGYQCQCGEWENLM